MKKFIVFGFFQMLGLMGFGQNLPNDCVNAITVCGNGTFVSNATGIGNIQEVSGCGGSEHNSLWLHVNIVQSGTLGFNLIPDDPDISVDYDFWVYAANAQCGSLGSPIRCCTTNPALAGLSSNATGMYGSTLVTQSGPGANGNGYVRWLNVTAGQSYYIAIDRPVGDGGFSLQWTGTATNDAGAFPEPPSVNELGEVRTCSNTPNMGIFNLDALRPQINADTTNNTVNFYTTLQNAIDSVSPLNDIISNTENPQQIYAKVTNNTSGCYNLSEFTLAVYPLPNATVSASPSQLCPGQSATVTFSGTPNAVVYYAVNNGTTQSITLNGSGTYSLSQALTQTSTFALQNAHIVTSDGSVVCDQALNGTATVQVSTLQPFSVNTPAAICSGNDVTLNLTGEPNATVQYYTGSNSTNTQTITLDNQGNYTLTLTGLTASTSVTFTDMTAATAPNCVVVLGQNIAITVNPLPEANTAATTYALCDEGAGQATFMLSSKTAEITNNNTGYTVAYYASQNDALAANANTLPDNYTTTSTTIYALVTDAASGCSTIVSFGLQVLPNPVLSPITALEACEENNNTATFNLTASGPESVNGAAGYTFTYYTTQATAINGYAEGQIATPSAYSSGTGAAWVRVITTGNTCYAVGEIPLTVHPNPVVAAITPYTLCDDPQTTGNVTTFNLTTKTTEANGGDASLTVTYYTSQADANSGNNAIANPALYQNTTSPQTIYVRVESDFGCYGTGSFVLTVNPLPAANTAVSPYQLCDNGNGQASFDLTTKTAEVANNNANYTVTYYLSQNDAIAGNTNTLPNIYETASTTIYARVADNTTGCFTVVSFALQALSSPSLSSITSIGACAVNGNTATFNLTPAGPESVGGATGYTFTYYATLTQAVNGGTAGQINPAAYTSTTGSAWIRVVATGTTTDCYSVGQIPLVVYPKPVIPAITNYVLCDNTAPAGNGTEAFNLTTKNTEVTTNSTDTVTYYTNQANAVAGTGAISNPAAYQNTTPWSQTIWVRVTTQYGCFDTASFTLIVNPLPQVNMTNPVFYACEETPGQGLFNLDEITPVILGGQQYTVTYYTSQADALAGAANNITANPYLTGSAVIYARAVNTTTGCTAIAPVTLQVEPAPIAPQPAPLEVCDDNNDNVATFNLLPSMQWIVSQMGGGVTVTVHESYEDASFQAGVNPIANPSAYTNVEALTSGGIQTVYIRVSSGNTTCFDVVPLQLIVHPRPVATDPLTDYQMCDNGANDTDGIAIFNLDTYHDTVLGTLNPAQYTVTYHQDTASAALGTPAIAAPTAYASASGTIYIRATNNTTGCYDVVALHLVVNPLPVVNQPLPYSLCDTDNPGDEREIFDLTSVIPEITGGTLGLTVSYYHTFTDAQTGTNGITNPAAYQNQATVEAIFVKVEDNETGCYRIVLLDIRVEPLPQLTQPTTDELTVCDTNGSGFGNFDLLALTDTMINNGVNLNVAFYYTLTDAQNGANAISNTGNYQNIVPYTQVIYAVATNTLTGCKSTPMAITLVVSPAPIALPVALDDLTACDDVDNNNHDLTYTFNLTVQDAVIYSQLNAPAGTLTIHYFSSQANAEAGTPRIVVPQAYAGTDGKVIWVRIMDVVSGCYQVSSFTLNVNEPQALATPTMFTLCNDALPNDNTAVFNLTVKNDEILTPFGIGESNMVEYFESAQNMANNLPIATPDSYTNIANPQTLYVRVTTPEGCKSYTFLTIRVLPLPTPDTTPDALVLCDDSDLSGNGIETFNLTLATADITDGGANLQLSYYTTQAAAWAGDTIASEYIAAPTAYANTTPWSDSVWVRVTMTGSEPGDPVCAQVVQLPLTVNPIPQVLNATGQIPLYAICNLNTTGYESFNLIGHITDLLTAAGETAVNYTIRFYLNQAAYNVGTALPNAYTNVTAGHQQILVYVKNNVTGCYLLQPLDLYAERAAIANNAPDITECDYDGSNDGFYTFDLTVQTATILGSQSPAGYSVHYYTDEAAAWAGDTASAYYIANPSAYTNASNPQTVYAVVTNLNTFSPCRDVTSFSINVELLAEPVIVSPDGSHTICVDYNTGAIISNSLVLTATDANIDPSNYNFTWYRDGIDVTVNPSENTFVATVPGQYTVVATSNGQGCVSNASAVFEVIQSGPASPMASGGYVVSNAFGDEQTVTVLVQGYGEYQYCIVPQGEAPLGPWQNSNVFTNVTAGYFDIYVRDVLTPNPCEMLQISNVSVIDYPRFFTPNGDGFNDYWNISGLENIDPTARIFIFDRYGKLIKQISATGASESEGWDGTYNGQALPADDYWFRVEFTEGNTQRVFKAHFALKR
ncbi:T9SS type B sorting domain-containing protein [Flavobacterium sp. RHBU_3]|uniref:T9SS type B sorting domain-containing protein n=1 Tax=Flavobacterium sp. RHBU_3 TaxID=3391184 RepID=UPI003984B027